MTNLDQLARPADEAEFNRIKNAGRGTLRFERSEDYIIIAHCHTASFIGESGPIHRIDWFVSVNFNGDPIRRFEFDSSLTFDQLETAVAEAITTHRQTAPAPR